MRLQCASEVHSHIHEAEILLEEVSRVFGTGARAVVAITKIDLEIRRGEFFSVVGPSGCGKTTLLRLVGGLLEPTAGRIQVRGKSARQARMNREYGMVFQQPVLLDWRSSLSNVEVPLEIMGHPIAERRARARAMLAVVGLRGFEDRYPWQLSGGMQQRVAIARALVYQPPVLLMDEPFGALDAITRENLQIELTDLWSRTDATVFFITHSIAEAVFLSDRVAIMTPRPGQIRDIVRIPLARPRDKATRRSFAFFELVDEVRSRLEASGDLDSGSRSMDADLEG